MQSAEDASHGVDADEDEEGKFCAVKGSGAYQNGCGQEAVVVAGGAGPSAKVFTTEKGSAAQPASPSGHAGLNDVASSIPDTGASPAVDAEELSELGLGLEPSTMSHAGELDSNSEDLEEAPSLMVPSQATPRYSAFLQKVASAGDEDVLADLADITVWNTLKYIKPHNSAEQPGRDQGEPYALSLRFEHLLAVTQRQRELYIEELASRRDPRAKSAATLIFTEMDMKTIMNKWRDNYDTWSNNLQALNNQPTAQRRHAAVHGRFTTMLFQLMGDKALVETFIKFPICSAEQPASECIRILRDFARNWQIWRNSDQRKAARKISEKKQPDDPTRRLGQQIFLLKRELEIGEEMQARINRNWYSWCDLTEDEKRIYHEFTNGTISQKIKEKKMIQRLQPASFEGSTHRIHALSQQWQPR